MTDKNTIGRRITELLDQQRKTQKWLAEKIGVKEATMSRSVHDRRIPNAISISKIALALNVSTDYLLGADYLLRRVIMENKKLSVCPFCGSEMEVKSIGFDTAPGRSVYRWFANCTNDKCVINTSYETEEEAVQACNKRFNGEVAE